VDGIVRTKYITAKDGKVKHVFPNVKVDGYIHQVLAVLMGTAAG
jgi:peroxiredoxin